MQTTTSKCTDATTGARLRVRGDPSTQRPERHGRRSEAIRSAPGLRGSAAHLPRTPTEATRATAPLPAASRSRPIPHGPVSPPPQAGPGPARTPPPLPRGPAARLPTRAPPARHGAGPGPGIRAGRSSGAGCGARPDGGAAEPGAAHAARAVRGRALTEEVMRRTAPRSPPDGRSASEPSPSPSLRTATAAQPPPQIASRFPCLLRRRCPLASARARRRGAPWDRWSGRRPPFRSR